MNITDDPVLNQALELLKQREYGFVLITSSNDSPNGSLLSDLDEEVMDRALLIAVEQRARQAAFRGMSVDNATIH